MSDDKVNILIVDDQPSKLTSLEVILSSLGENLIQAGSARRALELLLKHEVAVLLVDVCMPELDGFELAQVVRDHPRFQRTAIIFISAVHLADADRIKGYGLGAVDYIPVPIVPEMLRAKVAVFVDLYRKSRELERMNAQLEQRVSERTAELEASTAQLRESEERLNLALESAGAAPWDWDLTQEKMDWPPRFRELYGFAESDEASLEVWLERIHPEDRARLRERVAKYMTRHGGDHWSEEFRVLHPEGGLRWISSKGRVARNADGDALRLTGIDLDITERKQAEEDRARLLDSEREARAAAEQANRLKDDFLAIVSHELRSPINTVQMWLELARRKQLDPGEMNEAMGAIERGVRTQTRLINDLLDLGRITSGKLRIEAGTIDLRRALSVAVESVQPFGQAKNIRINLCIECDEAPVRGDAVRLQQVFGNLLDNGVKFTPTGGQVDVALVHNAGHALVMVSDNGPGIAREFLPHIFERFRQADSSLTRRHGGLGLGLTIVKHIVELHGGYVTAESEGDGKGSRFTVRLPLARERAAVTTLLGEPSEITLHGLRVLVVDDDDDGRQVLARLLSNAGADVQAVGNAALALQSLGDWRPHIMASDISMPDMDGYALMREVRRRGETLPTLAVTAFARPEDRLRAIDAGYDCHVSKPVNPFELLSVVRALADRALLAQSLTPATSAQ